MDGSGLVTGFLLTRPRVESKSVGMTTGGSESPSDNSGSDVQSSSKSSRNGKDGSAKRARKLDSTKIIQVANIAPQTTREQMMALFGYLGKVDDLRLYPSMYVIYSYLQHF